MKLLQKSMLFMSMLLSINLFSAGVSENIIQKALPAAIMNIVARFAPPAHIQKLIEENKETILFGLQNRADQPYEIVPGLYIKYDQFDRVINAYRMQRFLDVHAIKNLTVPKKYVYKVDQNFTVFVEAVSVEDVQSINLEEVKDLITFIEGTGYSDLHDGNLKRDMSTGKLIIIDTENRSFCKVRIDCFDALGRFFWGLMTQDAYELFQEHYETFLKPTLCNDAQYDEPGMNMQEVQNYIAEQARLLNQYDYSSDFSSEASVDFCS